MPSGRHGDDKSSKEADQTPDADVSTLSSLTIIDARLKTWLRQNVCSPAQHVYQAWVLEFMLRNKPLPRSRDGRCIPLQASHDKPLIDERRGHPYISNSIRSSRYTIWDFLPKQFIFQATRLSNFYFICIGIPQAIPGFSTTGNYTTILPLSFFLILTIIKEGYDDNRRHRLDKVENNTFAVALRSNASQTNPGLSLSFFTRLVHRLDSVYQSQVRRRPRISINSVDQLDADLNLTHHWSQVKWNDIKVGDVLKLKRNDPVPADVALLYASGEDGVAYVETMALDGETNLKTKQAPQALQVCGTIAGIKACNAEFVVEDPNRDLYDLKGSFTVDSTTIPLTLNEVLLRGSILRNTSSAIGIVVNTGEECRIRMNANHHPKAKKPRLERYTNQVVLTLILYVVILSVGCAVGYILWHNQYEVQAWYLNHAYVPFKEIIIGYLIMFNNVIPLALYVSLEIVKIGQMIMIRGDICMYDEASDTPMICNTNTILENLGQVSYVLSDKTGTLTENVMRFRGLSVAGTSWWHKAEGKHLRGESQRRKSWVSERINVNGIGKVPQVIVQEAELLSPGPVQASASASTSRPELVRGSTDTSLNFSRPSLTRKSTDHSLGGVRPSLNRRSTDFSLSVGRPSLSRRSIDYSRISERLSTSRLLRYVRSHPNSHFSHKVAEFILAIALCHTAIPETQPDGSTDFQASSPDEVALVRAAQDFGVVVCNRSSQTITLRFSKLNASVSEENYQIMDVIEFSSIRKRMSIIVRRPDGRIWLLSKGADSALIPRLKQASLATRKSLEVRRSVQLERDASRRNQMQTPRNSFGGRPSMTMHRGRSMGNTHSMEIQPVSKRNTLEVSRAVYPEKGFRMSEDRRRSRDSRLSGVEDMAHADEGKIFTNCFKHLNSFATEGLRTLVYTGKYISESDYAAWREIYRDATTALDNRQERIEAAADTMEQNLELIGASAIEDKLQEGVPDTIDKLRRANMKIWMLTGDKRETAINIAHSARICRPDSNVFVLDTARGSIGQQLRDLAADIQCDDLQTVAVIDGQTLAEIEKDSSLLQAFFSIITNIESVICCRASPAQKASIVQEIRARQFGLTMAIGDGANDIAMITASHVGIGISGKEGLQAARVADYSIAQFRFLQPLLLVHGRWNYVRTAKFILWTYWKEMFFYMVQALYQHTNGYTGSSLYENWSLTVLNTLFTSLCVIVPGIFEQDLKTSTLLAVPELYVYGQQNQGLNLPRYIRWMALAVAQGVLIWFLPWTLYGMADIMGDNGAFAIGDLCFSLAIMWTNTKLLMIETHYKTSIVIASFFITTGGWWLWNVFLCFAYEQELSPFNVRGGLSETFGRDPTWWLVLILTWAILVVYELLQKRVRQQLLLKGLWPPSLDNIRRAGTFGLDRTAEELDVEIWQQLEQDASVQARLRGIGEGEGESDGEVEESSDEEDGG